jgi:hypothetical protein
VISSTDRHPHTSGLFVSEPSRAPATALDALADAMESERKVVDDIANTMRRQRDAVTRDDLDAIDDSVFAMHRLLQTLGAARQRRRTVSQLFGAADDLPVRELESLLGPLMTARLTTARDALQMSARALSHEVQVNRRVLRDAMSTGEEMVRTLAGAPVAAPESASYRPTYAMTSTPASAPRVSHGILVDRTV